MALYAFDGTWNEDEENPTADTNVVHFRDAYEGPVEYRQGVGTRLGVLGRMAGGLFGAGGRSRIEEMYNAARTNWLAGDRVIDIVGFSRGAALAVHFANLVAGHGLKLPDGLVVQAPVRFLGVWDIVGSFGLPVNFLIDFQGINLGWTIDRVPQAVECCRHAMALDERRQTFGVTRLSAGPNVEELWFRGVHSDVGGGNTNIARSNLALAWMLEEGKAAGLPIARATIDDVAATANRHARVSSNLDIVRNRRRARHETDQHHPSAVADTLAPGQSATFPVRSSDHYNWTGVRAEQGGQHP